MGEQDFDAFLDMDRKRRELEEANFGELDALTDQAVRVMYRLRNEGINEKDAAKLTMFTLDRLDERTFDVSGC